MTTDEFPNVVIPSEVEESRNKTLKITLRDPSTSLGMTRSLAALQFIGRPVFIRGEESNQLHDRSRAGRAKCGPNPAPKQLVPGGRQFNPRRRQFNRRWN